GADEVAFDLVARRAGADDEDALGVIPGDDVGVPWRSGPDGVAPAGDVDAGRVRSLRSPVEPYADVAALDEVAAAGPGHDGIPEAGQDQPLDDAQAAGDHEPVEAAGPGSPEAHARCAAAR